MEPFDRYANELNLNMDASSYLDNISARQVRIPSASDC
jgi:hypothetical protein